MSQAVDVIVVGGGIVGLANAWSAAKRGLSVALFERDRIAQSASVRNFGMVWPIGQPPGEMHQRAKQSRTCWQELVDAGVVWADPCGSLHLSYKPDEMAVISEFVDRRVELGFECELLSVGEIRQHYPSINSRGLLGGLWSPSEMCVDPRAAIASIPKFLHERYNVQLRFGVAVRDVDAGNVKTSTGETWTAKRIVVCSGVDFQTLFPEAFVHSGIRKCKLQMMRTAPQPNGFRVGTMLAGGLTLCHYKAFEKCKSLPALKQRFDAEMSEYVKYGIHVMLSQNGNNECVIGDSHEYDEDITPFDKRSIDEMILSYLGGLVNLPSSEIQERWHGIYAKHPTQSLFTAEPQPNAHVVVAPGGAGMTMSFGFAEDMWDKWAN